VVLLVVTHRLDFSGKHFGDFLSSLVVVLRGQSLALLHASLLNVFKTVNLLVLLGLFLLDVVLKDLLLVIVSAFVTFSDISSLFCCLTEVLFVILLQQIMLLIVKFFHPLLVFFDKRQATR